LRNYSPWRALGTAEPVVAAEWFPNNMGVAKRQPGIGDPRRALPTVGFGLDLGFIVVLL